MLVVCEDTTVTPLVDEFMRTEGLADDDVLRVDSNRKGELKAEEWKVLRERLFDVDRHKAPRVIVSVLMLREGFDVNNICVIVPLRASAAGYSRLNRRSAAACASCGGATNTTTSSARIASLSAVAKRRAT